MSFEDYIKPKNIPIEEETEEETKKKKRKKSFKELVNEHKNKQAEEAKKAEDAPHAAENGETLSDILSDKEKSAFFGIYAEELGQKDLMQRLVEKKLETSDMGKLMGIRIQFIEKMHAAEAVGEFITPERLADLGQRDSDFQELMNIVGSKKSSETIKRTLKRIALLDENQFASLQERVEMLRSFENGEIKILNDHVEGICQKEGVSAEKYWERMGITDTQKRKEALINLIRKDWGPDLWGTLKRGGDWLTGKRFSREKIDRLVSKEQLEEVADEYNKHKQDLLGVLSNTINSDHLRNTFAGEAINERATEQPATGMEEAKKEAKVTLNERLQQADTQEQWVIERDKATQNLGKRKFGDLTSQEREEIKESFVEKLRTERKKTLQRQGFWAMLFQAIFGDLFASDYDKSKLK